MVIGAAISEEHMEIPANSLKEVVHALHLLVKYNFQRNHVQNIPTSITMGESFWTKVSETSTACQEKLKYGSTSVGFTIPYTNIGLPQPTNIFSINNITFSHPQQSKGHATKLRNNDKDKEKKRKRDKVDTPHEHVTVVSTKRIKRKTKTV
jgi:hypothetical protein